MGFAVAKLALTEKANIIIASSNEDKVNAAVKRLKADSPTSQVFGCTVDVTGEDVEEQLEKLFAESTKAGPLDHIVPSPMFLKSGYTSTSSITFTGGVIAEKPMPGYSVMATFTAGLHYLGKCLAVELAPLRVNVVAPGATETEMWNPHAETLRARSSNNSLLGKPAKPEDVAEAFVYLMKNADATGSVVRTNGGAPLK